MSIRIRSPKVYSYDVPWFLWNVFNWFLSVLFSGHLALIALANNVLYHAVHQGKPILLAQRLFCFGHSKMSQMVCCFNHLTLEACGYNDPVCSENQVIYHKELVMCFIEGG